MSAMDEWQRRMKAEKEAERQKKTQSADMLRGYRGGDIEEAKKIKAAREEDRRKKEEAQKALQEYKGTDMEELKKLKAQREEELRKKQDAQSMLHDYKAKEIEEIKPRRDSHYTHNNPIPTPVNRLDQPQEENGVPLISVSERAAYFTGRSAPVPQTAYGDNVKAAPDSLLGGPIEQLTTTAKTVNTNGMVSTQPDLTSAANETPGQFSVFENPMKSELKFLEPNSDNMNQQMASLPSVPVVDEKQQSNGRDLVRLDVLFSFGLVTINSDPDLGPYMTAVEEVVLKAIANDLSLATKVTYNRSHKPYVKSTQWDAEFKSKSGRPDVRRIVVTASAPVFLKSDKRDTHVSQTREGVVEALSAAIRTGEFLAIARKK